MERIRVPSEESVEPMSRRDSLSSDDDSYTPNSSQHQYHPHDMEQQPNYAIGSAV